MTRFSGFLVLIMVLLVACGSESSTATQAPLPTAAATLPPTQTMAPPTPTPTPGPSGTLEVRVTDQPADAVSRILVTLGDIEVHQSGGQEMSGWLTVVTEPQQFDLLKLRGIEELLGESALEVGQYQQVRFEVLSTLITVRGSDWRSSTPGGKIRLVGGFEINEGSTTIVTLDFDAERSVVFTPGQGPSLKPIVKLLVRDEGQPVAEAREVATNDTKTEGTANENSGAATSGDESAIRVVIPTNNNLQFISFWTALGAGYFEEEGLIVETVFPPSPDRAGQVMLQGMADIAVLPPPMYLPLIEAEEPVRIFGNLFEDDQINLIVRETFATENGLSTDLTVRERLEAIAGLKVGVAPGPPTRLRVLFESVGMDADTDIEMVITHGADQNDAFGDGSVDALYAHTPFLEEALNNQGAVILVNQSAGEVPGLNGRQSHSLVGTRTFISENRDDVVAFTRAVYRAQQLIHEDQDAVVGALLESGIPGLERELLETIVRIYAPAIPDSPLVSVKGIEQAVDLYPDHQPQPDLSGLDLADFVAIGIAEDAIAP